MALFQRLIHYGRSLSPQQVLNNAKDRIINGAKNTADCKSFENYLNALYYPKYSTMELNSQQKEMVETVRQEALEMIRMQFGKTLDNYNFGDNIFKDSANEDIAAELRILDGKFQGTKTHSKQIKYATIQKRLNEFDNYLKDLEKRTKISGFSAIEADVAKQVSDLYTLFDELLQESFLRRADMDKGYLTVKKYLQMGAGRTKNTWQDSINTLDKLYRSLRAIDETPIDQKAVGETFEKTLNVFSKGLSGTAKNLSRKLIHDTFKEKTLGSSRVSRGELLSVYTDYNVEAVTENKDKSQKKQLTYRITDSRNNELIIDGAFWDEEGKMDVEFIFPHSATSASLGNQSIFRVSAKSWGSLENRDFGSTSVGNALLRVGGFDPMMGYGLAAWYVSSHNKTLYENISQYVRACILVDTLMGYSQKNNYADTLVIESRSEKRIRVYSIYDILSNNNYLNNVLLDKRENEYFNDYALGNQIELQMARGRISGNYLQAVWNVLNSQKVKISSNILLNNI